MHGQIVAKVEEIFKARTVMVIERKLADGPVEPRVVVPALTAQIVHLVRGRVTLVLERRERERERERKRVAVV
jgi:hypothetical protein